MRYCDQIMGASEHVVELAEKINGFIAAKETPLYIESVDLRKLLSDFKEEFSLQLAARCIEWLEPQEEIAVRADRLSLLRTFRNLIDNALKYGGDRLSEIRIGYEETESCYIFSVSDNGRGMGKEDAEKVFQKFQRSGSSNGIEGAGLGLAIVRETAERHGGSVSIGEGIEGGGVTFRCSFSKNLWK
jgi:signal transduction histidine kinase